MNDKASAEVRKSQKAALDAWQRDQRERWFVKGVSKACESVTYTIIQGSHGGTGHDYREPDRLHALL